MHTYCLNCRYVHGKKSMIIDGQRIANSIYEEIRAQLAEPLPRKPCLAAIVATSNPASQVYVNRKIKLCHEVGMESRVLRSDFPTTSQIEEWINLLNHDPSVDGILLQLPLPDTVDTKKLLFKIDPSKDVDGFHPVNIGKLLLGDFTGFIPCTPLGIKVLLERSHIDPRGKHVVIVGRSNIVGKPLAALLMQKGQGCNATVTVAHSLTHNLKDVCKQADILVAAIGSAHFITKDMVKEGAIVIDVGINRIEDSTSPTGFRLVGDVDFNSVVHIASAITPVPKGVGPMTIAMLLSNTLKSFLARTAS